MAYLAFHQLHQTSIRELTIEILTYVYHANIISREETIKKFFKDISEQYDSKLGFESKKDKLQVEVNNLSQQKTTVLGEINAIPRLGIGVVKLFTLYQIRKCGGIKEAINKLSQPTQDDKESCGRISKEGAATLVGQANKSNGNEKIETKNNY
ncbi:MAG: hypothetical protein WBZ20_08895, partial [Nitrososphaeraceae archaeon]